MIRPPRPRQSAAVAGRSAATLTEVLMSLLVMSIGIVSVITMFPIAVLRSIQATQLTNSRMMTQNTEQAFRTLFRNSAAATYDVLDYHYDPKSLPADPQFRGRWQPSTPYRPGHIVTATAPKGHHLSSLPAWLTCVAELTSPGVSGTSEPAWTTGIPNRPSPAQEDWSVNGWAGPSLFDGSCLWTSWNDPTWWLPWADPIGTKPVTRKANGAGGVTAYPSVVQLLYRSPAPTSSIRVAPTFYSARNYVVDPLGWATFDADYSTIFDNSAPATAPSPNDFGYVYNKSTGLARAAGTRPFSAARANAANPFILRLNGGASTVAEAESLATHPDSWNVEIRATALTTWAPVTTVLPLPGIRSVEFPIGTDLSAISGRLANQSANCRIVLSNLQGQTYVRDIPDRIDNATTGPLGVDAAARIIRWQEPLPLGFEPNGPVRIERFDRRFTWLATVNRDFEGHSRVTVATFFKRGLKPEEEHAYSANVGLPSATGPFDQITLSWATATEPSPLIREGNYLLDAVNVAWYRIVAVSVSGASATVTVDRPVPMAQRTTTGRVILMRGIVELFEVTL